MKNRDDEMVWCIKHRRNLVKERISITKALQINGMEQFREVAINRLQRYIDDKHIFGDLFSDCDIQIDDIGIEKTREILDGYLPSQWINESIEYLRAENAVIEAQNNFLNILRQTDKKTIKNVIKSPEMYFKDEETQKRMVVFLKAELNARRTLLKLVNNISFMVSKCRFFFGHIKEFFSIYNALRTLKKTTPRGL